MLYSKRLWLTGLILLLLSCLAIDFVADIERSSIEQYLRTRVSNDSAGLIKQLEKEVTANSYLVSGLAAYIFAQPELDDEKIEAALRAIFEFGTNLRHVGAAPGNRIMYIHPLAGNEKALGLYYPDYPDQWLAIERAISLRKTVISGPIDLLQGGRGLVSRTPVFLADGTYWGILNLVMDFDRLFAAVGISPQVGNMRVAIRSSTGPDGPIMGDQTIFESNAVILPIAIPGGEWQLAAVPVSGWQARQEMVATTEIIALVVALCFIGGFLQILHSRGRIVTAKNRMEAILETTQEAIIVFDDAGRVTQSNVAAERLFAYSRSEMHSLNINTFLRSNNTTGGTVYSALEIIGDRQGNLLDIEGVQQNGSIIPLEINVGHAVINGRRKHICAARDISERKAAEARLVELATIDDLTRVMNRRSVLKSATGVFAMATRHGRPLSIMMIDADHFKKINDSYGHDAGDKVLVALATCIKDKLRTSDLFGRFGGEEFLVVMPETTIDDAKVIANRLLEYIRNLRIAILGGLEIGITVSIGISDLNASTTELAEVIEIADTALYAAKNSGRDCYSLLPVPKRSLFGGYQIASGY